MTKTTPYNLLVGITVALGSFSYGFGFAAVATSIGQPGFYETFDLSLTGPQAAYTNHILGAVNALFFFGAAVGSLTAGPTADSPRLGRKWTLFGAALLSVVGGALSAASVRHRIAMFIVMRTIQGAGLGCLATLVPIYLAEASTPARRGMLTGLHGFFLVAGYNASAWVGFGCFFAENQTFGWRAPIAFTTIPALVLAVGCLWIPESPRWLVMQGRTEEAWTTLRRLHVGKAGGSEAEAAAEVVARGEFEQMQRQIEFEQNNACGYLDILRTPAYRKRAFLACFIQLAAQNTGGLVINNYAVLIYTSIGLTGYMPLLMYALYTLVGAIGNLFSLLTMDKTGRRMSLLLGLGGCLIALVIEAAMIAIYVEGDNPNPAGQRVAVFAIFFFVFCYGLFLDAASFVYSSEIYPTNIRSRGVAMATFTYFAGCITYVTPGATAFANIGYKYFLVFACLSVISVIVVYFYFPETKGKSLEELAGLFGDPVVIDLAEASEKGRQEVEVEHKPEVLHLEDTGR